MEATVIGRKRWNRILRKFAVSVLWIWNTAPGLGAEPSALKFAGVPFTAGSTVQANAPLSAEEKTYAAQGGNPVPPAAVAVIATPAGFDPREVGQYWSSVPPAISNDRTGTTLSSFIAASDSLRAGCYWLEMARNLPAMIRRVGARR